jgi:GxxExxY protein
VIATAIAVHREFGSGLVETDSERTLHLELLAMGIEPQCQVPLLYKNTNLDCGYRVDLPVAGWLLLDFKGGEKLLPLLEAQLISHLRLALFKLGLVMNFGSLFLRDSILRRVNSSPPRSRLDAPREELQAMDDLSREVMNAAFEEHLLGRWRLRSPEVAALEHAVKLRGLTVVPRLPVNLLYHEQLSQSTNELTMFVDGRLMLASVSVRAIEPIHLVR